MSARPCPVVILNWNGWEDVLECLASLRAAGDRCEPWLIDNGSTLDRSVEARAAWPGLRVHRWPENHGWSGGYNRALREAAREGHPHAYLLNNDCRATPGFLAAVEQLAEREPKAAAVGSRIAFADPPGFLRFDGGNYYERGEQRVDDAPEMTSCRFVNGAGMLLRLHAFDELGPFDERFFCYHEETEWCLRARRRGWSILASGRSLVVHRCEGSNAGENSIYYRERNQFLLIESQFDDDAGLRACLVLEIFALGERAREAGRAARLRALAEALADGGNRRFGQRAPATPTSSAGSLDAWSTAVEQALADLARRPLVPSKYARLRYRQIPPDDRARATRLLAAHDPGGAAAARLAQLER